jgi:hypothetical protein
MGIGGSIQSAIASVAIAAVAIESPHSDLGEKFVAHVKRGDAFRPLRCGTLAHNPNAHMFDAAVAL